MPRRWRIRVPGSRAEDSKKKGTGHPRLRDRGPKDQRTKNEDIEWANRTYEKSHRLKKV
jgi:hypothetical protein